MQLVILITTILLVAGLVVYMRAQKPATTALKLIQQHRYEEAVAAACEDPLHRAEALKLLGRYEEAIESYRRSDDPAAHEGIALCLAHIGRNLGVAQRMMEENIALHPQIQEFQALGLAYILLRAGKTEEALRIFRDNVELLETRFRDDYTDPDPLLAETLVMYAALSEANGDAARAAALRKQAADWAPGTFGARASGPQ